MDGRAGDGDPVDPDRFVADLAAAMNTVLADPEGAKRMGLAGRRRAIEHFSWDAIAGRTLEVYRLESGRWVVASTPAGGESVRANPFEAVAIDIGRWWLSATPGKSG